MPTHTTTDGDEPSNKHPRSVRLADLRESWPDGKKWRAIRLAIDARRLGLDVAPVSIDPEEVR